MTRHYKPTSVAHDDPWDDRDEFEPPSLSRPTDKLLSEHSSSFMDLESAPSEKSLPAERRRCCTRLFADVDWEGIFTILLGYAIVFLLTLALSLAHFFVGARILKYPTDTLQYAYTYIKHYVGGTTVIHHGVGVTGAFMRPLAAGSAIMALVLSVLAGLATAVLTLARWKGAIGAWGVYMVLTMGSTTVAAVVAGVGVSLQPVEGLSAVHAFSAGGVGFAVLVVPLALFFVLAGALVGLE